MANVIANTTLGVLIVNCVLKITMMYLGCQPLEIRETNAKVGIRIDIFFTVKNFDFTKHFQNVIAMNTPINAYLIHLSTRPLVTFREAFVSIVNISPKERIAKPVSLATIKILS